MSSSENVISLILSVSGRTSGVRSCNHANYMRRIVREGDVLKKLNNFGKEESKAALEI